MKKLKIFLLLSILLCFGFMLSSEVHAQGDGPKLFEVGDVLPVTTQLKIDFYFVDMDDFGLWTVDQEGGVMISFEYEGDENYIPDYWSIFIMLGGDVILNEYDFGNSYEGYYIVDTSTWTLDQRTVNYVDEFKYGSFVTWEDLNASTEPSNAKIFEVGDVLPAGNIKISWDFTGKSIPEVFVISSSGDLFIEIFNVNSNIRIDINYEEFYADTPSYTIITLAEPCEITDTYGGEYDYNVYIGDSLLWEVVSPEYLGGYDSVYDGEQLEIEEGYILPEYKIGINLIYNNTGGPKTGTVTYTFGTYGQIILTAHEDNLSTQVTSAEITYNFTNPNWNIYMLDDSLANQSFGSTRGILFARVLLDFSWATEEERTITDITVEGDLEIDAIFTRILTEEELAYQEGYSSGYITAREIFGWKYGDDWYNGIDAWNLGEKYARELYGFYDSTTDEWLTVSEYVARYGTGNGNGNGNGSTGANDFYANFDKYFIPAMIIVFGGAIVLTILKVFKGRE